jgi:TetR/AcrR family transcriptional regulator
MPAAVRATGSKAATRRPQLRGERRRRRILAAAETLFAERGFSNTSLDAIASAVGIQQPGLHYYFASKRALYEAVVNEALGSLGALTEAALRAERPPAERVLDAIGGWVDAIHQRPSVARLMLHESANPAPETVPAIFGEVGAHVQRLLESAFAELELAVHPDDVFHFVSTVTGSTLFYASAMKQLMANPDAANAERSMERHKTLLLGTVRALLDEMRAAPSLA